MTGKKRSSSKKKSNKAKEASPAGFFIGEPCNFEAFAHVLMPVFAAEVLPKLDFKDVLSLAQVNKACNAMVWNEHGVVSLKLKDKMKINGYQMPPMLWAAHQGNLPAVKALFQAGEDVDEIGNHYRNSHALSGPNLHVPEKTALAVAATNGHSKVVGFLIDEGANLHLRGGNEKRTALLCACDYGHVECARMLIEAGSNVDARDRDMATPLILCSDNKKSAIPNMQLLLKHGANVNCASLQIDYISGNTALHHASYHGIEQTVTALLKAGAHVDAKSLTGKTAVCYAASTNRNHIVEELLNAGASVFPLVLAHSTCLKELTECKRKLAEVYDSDSSDS
jgi:ankyrin repeat protein